MSYGDTTDTPPDISPSRQFCKDKPVNARVRYDENWATKKPPWKLGVQCYMQICPDTSLFTKRLDLANTENPPAWARDSNGIPLNGWSCGGLGDRDTGLMNVPGSTILHEIIHCWPIFQNVPGWQDNIYGSAHYGKSYAWHKIIDYPKYNAACRCTNTALLLRGCCCYLSGPLQTNGTSQTDPFSQ